MHPDGERCESHLFGLFLGQNNLHVDNHTLVDHAQPDCFSNELYKGVLDDKSTGVFNGRVLVRRDAQKTNAYQSNKSIVLSDDAVRRTRFEARSDGRSAGALCRDFCLENDLIMRPCGDTMIIAPPLVIRRSEIDELIEKAKRSLDQTAAVLS